MLKSLLKPGFPKVRQHKQKVLFVICSHPRCGTHMLRTMLDHHSKIDCLGECFNSAPRRYAALPQYFKDSKTTLNAIESIWSNNNADAVGFVLQDFQEDQKNYRFQKPHLILSNYSSNKIKIIWLSRVDKLMQYISFVIALQTRKWMAFHKDEIQDFKPFKLDLKNFLSFLEKEVEYDVYYKKILGHFDSISITYEQLNDRSAINNVLNFLGVQVEDLNPDTLKQSLYSHPSEIITNFEEAKVVLESMKC